MTFQRIAAALSFATLTTGLIWAQAPAAGGPPRSPGFIKSNDPRVQNRTYHFADTGEDLPYCLFVSSKVSKDRKNPLIVSLHGLGIGPGYMCQGKAIDLAEEGGYILVALMGYNTGGWYGSPVINMNGRGGPPAARASGKPRGTQREGRVQRSRNDAPGVQRGPEPHLPDGPLHGWRRHAVPRLEACRAVGRDRRDGAGRIPDEQQPG